MVRDRDIAAFERRAHGYEDGWRGRLHHEIADRTAELALGCVPAPRRILDVGCGTGYLLRQLAARAPGASELVGIDAAAAMIEVARTETGEHGLSATRRDDRQADLQRDGLLDDRLRFEVGTAERLPLPGAAFDLVVSTTSFDHWADQQAGLAQCARVLAPGGRLVLVDQFSGWLLPTLLVGRRGQARIKGRATRLLLAAGLRAPEWHDIYAVIIRAVTASR